MYLRAFGVTLALYEPIGGPLVQFELTWGRKGRVEVAWRRLNPLVGRI